MAQKMMSVAKAKETKENKERLLEGSKCLGDLLNSGDPKAVTFVQYLMTVNSDEGENSVNRFIDLISNVNDPDLEYMSKNNIALYDQISMFFGLIKTQMEQNTQSIADLDSGKYQKEDYLKDLWKRFEYFHWYPACQFYKFIDQIPSDVLGHVLSYPLNILDILRITKMTLPTIRKIVSATHSMIPSAEYFQELDAYAHDMEEVMHLFFSSMVTLQLSWKVRDRDGKLRNENPSSDVDQTTV